MTHEVRTPLATIRTLIRSLLRRKDLPDASPACNRSMGNAANRSIASG